MPTKKPESEEIVGNLREVEIVLGRGGTTAEACQRIAVGEQTCWRWRKVYGGVKAPKVPQRQPKRGRLLLNDGACIRLRPGYPGHVWA